MPNGPTPQAERIEGGTYVESRPCAAERRPCAAQRRPLCGEEVLCAGRSYVLRELEEAPVFGRGSSDCAEWFDSSMLRELQEAPVPKGSHLCREVPCAEKI